MIFKDTFKETYTIKISIISKLASRGGYYSYAIRQVAYLFNKVILCIQKHAVMFVQVYSNPYIDEQIMNIQKWEVRRNIH